MIPPTDRLPFETLDKIRQYTAAGGKLISVGRLPTLDAQGLSSSEFAALSRQLFNPSRSTFVPEASVLAAALHNAAAPDLELSTGGSEIGFIRRKLTAADIYFVANTSNRSVSARASFATTHKFGERWDPDTGKAIPGNLTKADLLIELAPFESAVFVFGDTPAAEAEPHRAASQIADLSAGWNVIFPSIAKAVTEPLLTDWIADPATRFYSGVAVYQRDFDLKGLPSASTLLEVEGGAPVVAPPSAPPSPGMRAWYDPPVREAAIVFLNGQRVGSLWHPPYRLAVGTYLRSGRNHIEFRVYNTAINAWAAKPPHDYRPLIAKYGDRFQMQDLDKVAPVSSGLLGKIRLIDGGY